MTPSAALQEPSTRRTDPDLPQAGSPGSSGPGGSSRATRSPGKHAHRSIGLMGRLVGWVHDRLPPTLQGSVGLTSAHVTVIALLVAAAMGAAGWWVLRADGGGTLVPAAAAPTSTAGATPLVELPADNTVAAEPGGETGAGPTPFAGEATATTAPSPAPPPSGQVTEVIVDIAGKVRRPGIATLPAGSRVVDALRAAGGARKGVNLTALNLARVLMDGEQIVVGVPAPSGVAAPAASSPLAATPGAPATLVNLNSADQALLETLPGVGPVTALAILAWRTENGAFSAVDELLEVSGIGEATLAEMAPFVTI